MSEDQIVVLVARPTQDSVEIDWWRKMGDGSGDLRMDAQGIYTQKGAGLALVADTPDATYTTCSGVKAWVGRVTFDKLRVGSQLCARSYTGRFASIRVTSMPSETPARQFVFHGIVWFGP